VHRHSEGGGVIPPPHRMPMKIYIYKNIKTGKSVEKKRKVNDPDLKLVNVRHQAQADSNKIITK